MRKLFITSIYDLHTLGNTVYTTSCKVGKTTSFNLDITL